MNEDRELISRLERLAAVSPSREATDRAVERTRRALAEIAPVKSSTRRAVRTAWAAVAVLLFVAVGLAAWLLPPLFSGRAWADVQAAMKAVHSVSFREINWQDGGREGTSRATLLDNGLGRIDQPDGSYTICDFVKSRQMSVDPRKRTALLFQGVNNMPPANVYDYMKNLANDATARPIPGKKIDGREAIGFEIKVRGSDAKVWADAKTRLPVRIELEAKDEKGKKLGDEIFDEFVFDKEVDARRFSFDLPAGYKMQTFGIAEVAAAPTDNDLLKPTVTPLIGIGPVKFGTSIADVEKLLGKADSVIEVGKNGYTEISYWSRGYFFGAGKTAGVVTVSCSAQASMAIKTRDFAGKTDKSVAMGASVADIIRAYGEPDRKETGEGSTYLTYNRLQCNFTLFNDKLVQMNFNRPRPMK